MNHASLTKFRTRPQTPIEVLDPPRSTGRDPKLVKWHELHDELTRRKGKRVHFTKSEIAQLDDVLAQCRAVSLT